MLTRASDHGRNSGSDIIVSELCVGPVGSDVSGNRARDWPVSLGIPGVRVTERQHDSQSSETERDLGGPSSAPHFADEELHPER